MDKYTAADALEAHSTGFGPEQNQAKPEAKSEPQFTPGPWHVGGRGKGHPDYVYCNDVTGSAVARTNFEFVDRSTSERAANMRLIAAAPTMAEYVRNRAAEGCLEAKAIWEAINASA